jgi:hypothetical protein
MDLSFPAMVYIDDECDACGHKGVMGVSWGYDAPVLCVPCLLTGAEICARFVPPDRPLPTSGPARRRTKLESV